MGDKTRTKIPSWSRWAIGAVLVLVLGAFIVRYWSRIDAFSQRFVASQRQTTSHAETAHDAHGEEESAHSHEGHSHEHGESNSLELSPQALENLGLTPELIQPVALRTFHRSISIPGQVVAKPGRTHIQVTTPMTGVITHVHSLKGEAVDPGSLLFRIRLTHEDLVLAQTEFLKSMLELEVENREVARLQDVARDGAIPGSTLLQRRYAKEKLEAMQQVQRESLRLHGLSDKQIDSIARERRLLRELQITAPGVDGHDHEEELRLSDRKVKPAAFFENPSSESGEPPGHPLIIEELDVHKGQSVEAGARLCVLADYSQLYIEGNAFEQDVKAIIQACDKKWGITAACDSGTLENLNIAYVPNEVDSGSRTLHFYVELPNHVEQSTTNADGQRFVTWRYRPGQRLQLELPVEEWVDQIVLPVDAISREGAETYVFQQNGDHFDRVTVHVRYQDAVSAVVANDGSIFPGDVVALKSAHQLSIALKNKSGGGVDPHAGHNH